MELNDRHTGNHGFIACKLLSYLAMMTADSKEVMHKDYHAEDILIINHQESQLHWLLYWQAHWQADLFS
jgi:hypothetical protein